MAVEAGFGAFWQTLDFHLKNRIFLTVSNSCLILKQVFQAGIKRSGILGAALGASPLFTSMAEIGSGRQLKGALASLSQDPHVNVYICLTCGPVKARQELL